MTIPNYITIFRFILVPFIVMALLSGYVGAALIGFVMVSMAILPVAITSARSLVPILIPSLINCCW
ncbi:CDP-alcohol phosphatidyltransferase family protein [Phyllobacterium sp. P30BS-XVII]|uniref:CDP-alcohol phosphatidyltransferase family protein n=1 Tax=Phyllobacterium sp. P30BS-XVII TaxID=2587046 RepID=UPI0017BFA678|nr:phosphatidylglycerophosphate synthase [Phyllobacterium sp. P30BS-XVII]